MSNSVPSSSLSSSSSRFGNFLAWLLASDFGFAFGRLCSVVVVPLWQFFGLAFGFRFWRRIWPFCAPHFGLFLASHFGSFWLRILIVFWLRVVAVFGAVFCLFLASHVGKFWPRTLIVFGFACWPFVAPHFGCVLAPHFCCFWLRSLTVFGSTFWLRFFGSAF